MDTAVIAQVEIEEMTCEDGRSMLNALTRDRLGMSVEDFLKHLDAGDYADAEDEEILRLAMLAPFARA